MQPVRRRESTQNRATPGQFAGGQVDDIDIPFRQRLAHVSAAMVALTPRAFILQTRFIIRLLALKSVITGLRLRRVVVAEWRRSEELAHVDHNRQEHEQRVSQYQISGRGSSRGIDESHLEKHDDEHRQ